MDAHPAPKLNGVDITVTPTPGSRLASLHNDAPTVVERTTCNYGLHLDFDELANTHGMQVAGRDDLGEVRAIERSDHPFFIATLYQPQLSCDPDNPHPLFVGLVTAAAQRH